MDSDFTKVIDHLQDVHDSYEQSLASHGGKKTGQTRKLKARIDAFSQVISYMLPLKDNDYTQAMQQTANYIDEEWNKVRHPPASTPTPHDWDIAEGFHMVERNLQLFNY